MKKYELVNYDKETNLYQIQALRDGPWGPKGTLGGFVESENNLSHENNCWIYENTHVFGDAHVFGNAYVFGNARISGNAHVYGNAQICENAHVYGNAKISGDAWIYGNAKIFGTARIYRNTCVSGNALIYGIASICGTARISGNAQISAGKHTKTPLQIQGSKDHITVCNSSVINVGCESHSIDEWLERAQEIGKANNYTDEEIQEYLKYFKIIKESL